MVAQTPKRVCRQAVLWRAGGQAGLPEPGAEGHRCAEKVLGVSTQHPIGKEALSPAASLWGILPQPFQMSPPGPQQGPRPWLSCCACVCLMSWWPCVPCPCFTCREMSCRSGAESMQREGSVVLPPHCGPAAGARTSLCLFLAPSRAGPGNQDSSPPPFLAAPSCAHPGLQKSHHVHSHSLAQ